MSEATEARARLEALIRSVHWSNRAHCGPSRELPDEQPCTVTIRYHDEDRFCPDEHREWEFEEDFTLGELRLLLRPDPPATVEVEEPFPADADEAFGDWWIAKGCEKIAASNGAAAECFKAGWIAALRPTVASPANSVPIPTSFEQAALMNLLSERWLRENAPERCKPATVEAGPAVTVEQIVDVMQGEWNEFVADTGCFPDDFTVTRGPTLTFKAGRWAEFCAQAILTLISEGR